MHGEMGVSRLIKKNKIIMLWYISVYRYVCARGGAKSREKGESIGANDKSYVWIQLRFYCSIVGASYVFFPVLLFYIANLGVETRILLDREEAKGLIAGGLFSCFFQKKKVPTRPASPFETKLFFVNLRYFYLIGVSYNYNIYMKNKRHLIKI